MKKYLIILCSLLLSATAFAQFPVNQALGNPNQAVYYKGAIGADSGIYIRSSVYDTIAANAGFLDGVPGLIIRDASDNIWMRNATATKWIGVGKAVEATNGLNMVGLQIGLGGAVDSGAVLKVRNVEINGHKNSRIVVTNDTTDSYFSNYTQSGNLSGSLFDVTKVWRENRGDTLNLQYGGAMKTLYDRFYDSTSSRFGNGKTPIGLTNMGVYAQARFYPPRDSVNVLTSTFGATGSLFAAALGIGDSYGYNIHIAPADANNNPGLGLSVNKSEIDFVRVIDNTRRKQLTGAGITSYMSDWKFYQNTMNASSPKVENYASKAIGFQAYGGVYTKIGGSLIKDSIFRVAKVDSSIAFLAEPQWRIANEVYNGYGFVSLGDSDYNYMAGKTRIGGIMPTRDNGGLDYNLESFGYSRINAFRFDSTSILKDVDSLYNGTSLMILSNRGTNPVININRYATSYSKFLASAPEAAIIANGGFSGTVNATNIGAVKSIFGRTIYNLDPHPDSTANTTVTLNAIPDFYIAGVSGGLTAGSRVAITTDTLKIVSPKTAFGASAVAAHIDFHPATANVKHIGEWNFYTSHWDNKNTRAEVERLITYRLPSPETTVLGRTKVQDYIGLYAPPNWKYSTDIARAWPIYISDSNTYNYFADHVMIGDTTVSELGGNSLYVNGSVRIADGTQSNGYVLTSDANGNASWQPASGGGGGSPAGSNGQIQFNSSGSFGASSNLTWDDTNVRLGVGDVTFLSDNEVLKVRAASGTTSIFRIQSPDDGDYVRLVSDNSSGHMFDWNGTLSFRVNNSQFAIMGNTLIDFNTAGINQDFRIRGDNTTNLFYIDASVDRVGINTNAPDFDFDVAGMINVPGTETQTFRWATTATEVPTETTYTLPTNYIGSSTNYALFTPDVWLRVNVNGTLYGIPAYLITAP